MKKRKEREEEPEKKVEILFSRKCSQPKTIDGGVFDSRGAGSRPLSLSLSLTLSHALSLSHSLSHSLSLSLSFAHNLTF